MNPSAPIFFPIILLFIFGLGRGMAWYWCELTRQQLTDGLINFSIAVVAFFTVLDYICLGINKYVARTVGDTDEKKLFGLKYKLYSLLLTIIFAIGWLVLNVIHLT